MKNNFMWHCAPCPLLKNARQLSLGFQILKKHARSGPVQQETPPKPQAASFLWEQAWKQPQCGHVGLAPILSHSCEEQLSWGFFVTPTWWCFKANVSTPWVRRGSWWGGPGWLSMNYCLMGISNHIYTIAWNSSSILQSEILNIYHGYIGLFICHLAMDFRWNWEYTSKFGIALILL